MDLSPCHLNTSSRGLINYIADSRFSKFSGFEFYRHAGSAGSPNDVSTCFRVCSTCLGDTSPSPPTILIRHPSWMPSHRSHAQTCMPLHSSGSSSSLVRKCISLLPPLCQALFLTCSHKTKNTITTHTHTHPRGFSRKAVFETFSLAVQRMWPSVKRLQNLHKDTVSVLSVSCIVPKSDPAGLQCLRTNMTVYPYLSFPFSMTIKFCVSHYVYPELWLWTFVIFLLVIRVKLETKLQLPELNSCLNRPLRAGLSVCESVLCVCSRAGLRSGLSCFFAGTVLIVMTDCTFLYDRAQQAKPLCYIALHNYG